jgi:membrane protease YdiL (CAAX protease family)
VDIVQLPKSPDSAATQRQPWLRPELIAPWWQIVLVLICSIGVFAGKSTYMALHGSGSHYINLLLTNSRLLNSIAGEGVILTLLLGFLHWRGWKPGDFKIRPSGWSSLQGFVLFIAVTVGNSVTVMSLFVLIFLLQTSYSQFLPYLIANSPHLAHHSIAVLILSMILNAFYEEMTCMGYAFNQFAAKRGPLFALLLTVLLRMSCHSYQGPVHMLGIGMVFTLFGICYWYTRNLWPLIFAHAALDICSTGFIKLLFG